MARTGVDSSLFDYDAGYYEVIPGLWMPGTRTPPGIFTFSSRAIKEATAVKLDDSDILIATYPKTGQTWLMTIIHHLTAAKELEAGVEDIPMHNLMAKMPFMETEWSNGETGADQFNKLEPPRFMKTHLPLELYKKLLDENPKVKVVTIMRNPKDTAVSFYHHLRSEMNLGGFHGSFDEYFEQFKQKRLPGGDYFDIIVSWYKYLKNRENSLILKYEEMKKEPKAHIIKIAKFLGIEISDKVADIITERTKAKNMAGKINGMITQSPSWNSERGNFLRKGIVGDWASVLSNEQSEFIDAKCKEYLEPLGITFDYSMQI